MNYMVVYYNMETYTSSSMITSLSYSKYLDFTLSVCIKPTTTYYRVTVVMDLYVIAGVCVL